MTMTIIPTKVEAYDSETLSPIFTLEADDKGVHRIKMDDFVSSDGLVELFDAIRAAVKMMDTEKEIGSQP